jgi:hypothetical protein
VPIQKSLLSWGFPKGQKEVVTKVHLIDGNPLPFYFFDV